MEYKRYSYLLTANRERISCLDKALHILVYLHQPTEGGERFKIKVGLK